MCDHVFLFQLAKNSIQEAVLTANDQLDTYDPDLASAGIAAESNNDICCPLFSSKKSTEEDDDDHANCHLQPCRYNKIVKKTGEELLFIRIRFYIH